MRARCAVTVLAVGLLLLAAPCFARTDQAPAAPDTTHSANAPAQPEQPAPAQTAPPATAPPAAAPSAAPPAATAPATQAPATQTAPPPTPTEMTQPAQKPTT